MRNPKINLLQLFDPVTIPRSDHASLIRMDTGRPPDHICARELAKETQRLYKAILQAKEGMPSCKNLTLIYRASELVLPKEYIFIQ